MQAQILRNSLPNARLNTETTQSQGQQQKELEILSSQDMPVIKIDYGIITDVFGGVDDSEEWNNAIGKPPSE